MLMTQEQLVSTSTAISESADAAVIMRPQPVEARPTVMISGPANLQRPGIVLPWAGEPTASIILAEYSQPSPGRQRNWELDSLVRNHPALTDTIRRIIKLLWTSVLSKALQSNLVADGAVDVEEFKEEEGSQVVLRVYLEASASQALAFWDGLEVDLDRLMNHLDKRSKQVLVSDIGLRIHWNVN